MRLWILRHAEAAHPLGVSDADRPLSETGLRQAETVAGYLRSRARADAIWCSPLTRARETADAIVLAIPQLSVRTTESLVSESDPLNVIRELEQAHLNEVILISHEPLTGDVAVMLLPGSPKPGGIRFSPATLALLESSGRTLRGSMTMRMLIPPDALELSIDHSGT